MSPVLDRVIPALVGLTAFGGLTAWLGWQCWLARSSRRWPSTVGRILSSEVVYDPHRLHRVHAFARIRYEYEVDGRRYVGGRVKFGGWLNTSRRNAGFTTIRYRAGSPVSVRFDPRRPTRATLERRVAGHVLFFLAIGVFMTGSILGALMGWWN